MSMADCPHCGLASPADAAFCAHCGTNLARRPPPDAAGGETPPTPQTTDGAPDSAAQKPAEPVFGQEASSADPAPEETGREPSPRHDVEGVPNAEVGPARPVEAPLAGLSGLLEAADPLEFLTPDSSLDEDRGGERNRLQRSSGLDEEERRQLRELYVQELPLSSQPSPETAAGDPIALQPEHAAPRLRLLELLLLLGLAAALFWEEEDPSAHFEQHVWPGLVPAHRQIETLRANGVALLYWAYDPATAGEMDLVVLPVIEHLLIKQAKLIVVSQVPGGPATARRLIKRAEASVRRARRPADGGHEVIEAGYLPGGAASLALLGTAPARTLPVDSSRLRLRDRFTLALLAKSGPSLTVLVAARAEDVKRWLEQVQPVTGGESVAVVSGVADPALRPYLQSGQLAGLVSGWDGGSAYRRLSERAYSPAERYLWRRRSFGQNWGLAVLIVAAALGNLTRMVERRQP